MTPTAIPACRRIEASRLQALLGRALGRLVLGVLLVPLLASAHGRGQEWPLRVELFQEAVGAPFVAGGGLVGTQLHPGLAVATEYRWWANPTFAFLQSGTLLGFAHSGLETGLGLLTEGIFRANFFGWLEPEVFLGLGYVHFIPDAPAVNLGPGGATAATDFGRPRLGAELGIGVGFRLPVSFSPIVSLRYQLLLESPFSGALGAWFLPHVLIELGLSVPLFPASAP